MKGEYDFVQPMVDHFSCAAEFNPTPREAPFLLVVSKGPFLRGVGSQRTRKQSRAAYS